VLPDSHWLKVSNYTIEKWSASAEKAWSVETPAKEPPLPGLSVAANNTVYMRDKQRLLALGSNGAWLWERAEPIGGAADASYFPVAMTDSGVVVRTDQKKYRAYSATGELRWTSEVELKGAPIEKPLVLPNGTIIIRSAEAFVALAPDDGIVL
jgi:outer membrane protein assembly factor BamB